jgi:RNA polymerase sigma factor (TIGR02999 family)
MGKRSNRESPATPAAKMFFIKTQKLCVKIGSLRSEAIIAGKRRAGMESNPGEITQLLQRWRSGDREAENRLFELLIPDLHKIAACCLRNERPGHSLQPTALVNETFLRLVKSKDLEWQDRGHFLAISARIMRRYLIDRARRRPNVNFLPMDGLPERVLGTQTPLELAITIDTLLDELQVVSQRRRAVVELKFFLGLSDGEAAEALHLTLHTLQREWYRARRWLFERLGAEPCQASSKIAG